MLPRAFDLLLFHFLSLFNFRPFALCLSSFIFSFSGLCGVIEQKDEGGQQPDSACGAQTQPGHAGLCEYDALFSIIYSWLKQLFMRALVLVLSPVVIRTPHLCVTLLRGHASFSNTLVVPYAFC